jgi:hypothetical protein
MDQRLRAPTDTIPITPTHVHRTAITDLIGSQTASLSVPVPGTTGIGEDVGIGEGVVSTAAAAFMADAPAFTGAISTTGFAALLRDIMAADSAAAPRQLISTVEGASTEEAGFTEAVVFTAEAAAGNALQ